MVARLLEVRSRFSVVFSVLIYCNLELSLRFVFIFFLITFTDPAPQCIGKISIQPQTFVICVK